MSLAQMCNNIVGQLNAFKALSKDDVRQLLHDSREKIMQSRPNIKHLSRLTTLIYCCQLLPGLLINFVFHIWSVFGGMEECSYQSSIEEIGS